VDIKDLNNIASFNDKKCENLSLALLTAYSLYWLEEWMIPTTIEAISVINFKFFPSKFSMVGFPQYPDALRTNRSLLQLGRKYRNMVTGSNKKGFFLNQKGRDEAEGLVKRIGMPSEAGKAIISKDAESKNVSARGDKQARTKHPEDVMAEVKNSTLFRLYSENNFTKPPLIHLLGLLKLYENAPKREKMRILREYEIAAEQVGEKEVIDFVRQIQLKFKDYIDRN